MPPLEMNEFPGAGAIRSTVSDLLTFLAAHIHAEEGSVLSLTHEPRVTIGKRLSAGLGWLIEGDIIVHNGATSGFSSYMAFHKKSRSGVVVLSNYRNSLFQDSPDRIGHDLLTLITATNE